MMLNVCSARGVPAGSCAEANKDGLRQSIGTPKTCSGPPRLIGYVWPRTSQLRGKVEAVARQPALELGEQWSQHERDGREELDEHVQRRASGVLEGVTDCIAHDGRCVRV